MKAKAKKTEPAIDAVMIVDPSEYGLDKEQGKEMESQFLPVIAERNLLAEEYTRIIGAAITPAIEKEAGDLRRKFVKVRTNTDSIHKVAKAYFLAGGRYVDAWKNKNNVIVEQMEEKLKEIETTSERARVEVAKKLEGDRLAELAIYTEYPAQGLAFMPEEVYQNYLVGVKVSHQNKLDELEKQRLISEEGARRIKLGADRKNSILPLWSFLTPKQELEEGFDCYSEEEWIEVVANLKKAKSEKEAKEEQTRLENVRLQKEAEVKKVWDGKRNEELRPYIIFIRDYSKMLNLNDTEYQKELADTKIGAQQHWDFEKEQNLKKQLKEEARQKEIDSEISKRVELEAELKVKKDIELKAQQETDRKEKERIAAEEKAAKAPDKEKMIKWINSLNIAVPELSNINSKAIANLISQKFEGFKNWAKTQIETI